MNLKSSKHRCRCYSQESSSFLYGLRRDAPSTERVLLERLLNILSRAAAHRNKNPQRLWAESERPEWWTEVTDLPWKNPREHPKDNKGTLKKKIEILEFELKKRNRMTKELKEELVTHRVSKKVDLELKSDFEAVIAKASGLHFMLDKVYSKMGKSRIISDKMATYISETKSCVEKISKRINTMYEQVQAREQRKSTLWEKMGVSKQMTGMFDDLDSASLMSFDIDEESLDVPDTEGSNAYPTSSIFLPSAFLPSLATVALSPQSPEMSDPDIGQMVHHTLSPPTSSTHQISCSMSLPVQLPTSHSEFSRSPVHAHRLSSPVQRSAAESEPAPTEPETVRVTDLSQGRSVSLALQPQSKRTWRQSLDELEENELIQMKMKPRKVRRPQKVQCVPEEGFTIDSDDDADVQIVDDPVSWSSVVSRPASATPASDRGAGKDSKRTTDTETERVRKHLRSPYPHVHSKPLGSGLRTATAVQPRQHSSFLYSVADNTPSLNVTRGPSLKQESSGRVAAHGANISTGTQLGEGSALPPDVTTDAEEEDVLQDVEAILEVSDRPTLSMYAQDTMRSDIEHLASMTRGLSCDDLSPSVMEEVMVPSPGRPIILSMPERRPQTPLGMRTVPAKLVHGLSQTTSTSSSPRDVTSRDGNGGKSLSRAIGDLFGDFLH